MTRSARCRDTLAIRICAPSSERRSVSTTLPDAKTLNERLRRRSPRRNRPGRHPRAVVSRRFRRRSGRDFLERRNHRDTDKSLAPGAGENADRQGIDNPAIDKPVAPDFNRHTNAGNGEAGVDGGRHIPVAENLPLECVKVRGDDAEFAFEFAERHTIQRLFKAALDRPAVKQSPHRRQGQVQPAPQVARGSNLRREGLEFPAVVAGRPQRSHVGTHARPGDDIDFDPIFFEHLDHPDMREPPRTAG